MTTVTPTVPPTRPQTFNRWPWIILALLVGHVALMAVCVTLALRGHGAAGITPDYYQKSLDWDESKAIARQSDALGWAVTLTPDIWLNDAGQRKISLQARDAQGQPLAGAHVKLAAYHRFAPTQQLHAVATEQSPGHYTLQLPMTRPGEWRITAHITHGEQTYQHSFDQQIANPQPNPPEKAADS